MLQKRSCFTPGGGRLSFALGRIDYVQKDTMYLKRFIVSMAIIYGAAALFLIKGKVGNIVRVPLFSLAAIFDLDIHPAVCAAARLAVLGLAALNRVTSILAMLWFVVSVLLASIFFIVADPYKVAAQPDCYSGRADAHQFVVRPYGAAHRSAPRYVAKAARLEGTGASSWSFLTVALPSL
jgi:hypothetical protein